MASHREKHGHSAHPRLGRRIGHTIGRGIDETLGFALGTVGRVGRVLGRHLHLTRNHNGKVRRPVPGTSAGIEHMPDVDTPPPSDAVVVRCIDYAPDQILDYAVLNLDEFLAASKPDWAAARWINVDGLHPYIVNRFRERYGFHTLAAEDVLHTHQRPRAEPYDQHLFIVTQMMMLRQNVLRCEQVSIFFFPGVILTFQESPGDVWDHVRERLHTAGSRVRTHQVDYLLYSLLDALVDNVFPILEHYGDMLESIELELLEAPTASAFQRVHTVKRDLLVLRRALWPLRQLIQDLWRDEEQRIEDRTQAFFRDVYEHAVQTIDIIETYREISASLTELYMTSVSARLNEVMKVLTIIATIFVPLTFLAGVYGMNFHHLPELQYRYSYPLFWVICLSVAGGLVFWFRRKGWLGRSDG